VHEQLSRDQLELAFRRARRPPLEFEVLAAAAFKMPRTQHVLAGGQLDLAVFGDRAVQAVVVDDELVVDPETGAIVADEAEAVRAGPLDRQIAGDLGDDLVLERLEITAVGPQLERRDHPDDIRQLARRERRQKVHARVDLVDAQQQAGLARLLCLGGADAGRYGCQNCQDCSRSHGSSSAEG